MYLNNHSNIINEFQIQCAVLTRPDTRCQTLTLPFNLSVSVTVALLLNSYSTLCCVVVLFCLIDSVNAYVELVLVEQAIVY